MFTKIKQVIILSFLLLALLPLFSVSADTGPKPSMDFTFKQETSTSSLTIKSGILFECDQSDCQDAKPLQVLGPQRFSCTETACSAMAYGFSTYHRLEIQFSDGKTRRSNIFRTAQFQSSYQVTIRSNDLLVTPIFTLNAFTPLTYLLLCLGCLVGIVILVFLIIFLVRRSKVKK
jgi:hypothetical protein